MCMPNTMCSPRLAGDMCVPNKMGSSRPAGEMCMPNTTGLPARLAKCACPTRRVVPASVFASRFSVFVTAHIVFALGLGMEPGTVVESSAPSATAAAEFKAAGGFAAYCSMTPHHDPAAHAAPSDVSFWRVFEMTQLTMEMCHHLFFVATIATTATILLASPSSFVASSLITVVFAIIIFILAVTG